MEDHDPPPLQPPVPATLTPEQLARLDRVQSRCLAESQEVNPNLLDTGAQVSAHGFVWCRGRRFHKD